jgi:inosine triphosphate pyrophosphatase
MSKVTFITGNEKKAAYLEKYLGYGVAHQKLEVSEPQSLDLREIAEHKAREAHKQLGSPVLVEDISFSMEALGGKLPGPFIKWFLEEMGLEGICKLADLTPSRKATTAVCYVYFDGDEAHFFEGELEGTVPAKPTGQDGFGWNSVFIPDGTQKTNAELSEDEVSKFSLRAKLVYPKLKEFLSNLDTN